MNKVIIIGGSNSNELGLVRSFGVNGIKPYGILIGRKSDIKKASVIHSRYWKCVDIVDNEEKAYEFLLSKYNNEQLKPVLIFSNDSIMQCFDRKSDYLKDDYIFSGFSNYKISEYISKQDQVSLFNGLGYKMLDSRIVRLCDEKEKNNIVNHITFPMILKPVQGGEGAKWDIKIVYSNAELVEAYNYLLEKGYSRILVQHYLENRKEYLIAGAISYNNNFVSYTLMNNIRQWPLNFGVGSFSITETDENINLFVRDLLQKLADVGYSGLIDLEFFSDKSGEFYINEANWRSSGRNWISLFNGVYSTVWWYMNETGQSVTDKKLINDKRLYAMYGYDDIKHVLYSKLRFMDWLKDYRKTDAFSAWYSHDVVPYIIENLHFVKTTIKNRTRYKRKVEIK